MNPLTLWQLFFEPNFQAGFAAALLAVGFGLLVRRFRPDWGVLWALAAAGGYAAMDLISSRTLDRVFGSYSWSSVGAVLCIVAAALGIGLGRERPGLPLAIGLTVGGVWATVPDTLSSGVLMGVTAALLWIWWPKPYVAVGWVGAVLVPAVVITAVILGGIGRASGLMGGLGVVGVLLIYPIGRPTVPAVDVGIQLLAVLGWSRWAGLSDSAPEAFVIGVVVTVLAVAAKLAAPVAYDRIVGRSSIASG